MDSTPLLASAEVSDNVLSILTHLSDQQQAIEQIVSKIAAEPEGERRKFYLEALLILAGLRDLEEQVEKEVNKVPVFIDILENKVLGREYKRGHQEGLQEGRQEGERAMLRLMLEKRFGALPEWTIQRLGQLTEPELRDLGLRLLEVRSLEELLPN